MTLTRTRRRGHSIAEAVIAAAMLALMLSGVVTLTISMTRAWSGDASKMMADSDASTAFQSLAQDLRVGLRASVGSSGDLTVVLPAVNSQGDYDRFQDGASVRYYLSSGTLYRQQGSATPTVLARRLTSVTFAVDGSQVGVQLTCRQQVGTRAKTTTFNTRVLLRNEPVS